MKKWLCVICGLIYDEALGWPDDGIVAGTRWEDVPEDWLCPECKVGKADFEMIEISEPVKAVAASAVISTQPSKATPTTQPTAQPIVIIGSGHAGYGLAQALRKADPQLDIRVLTEESGYLYAKPALSIALAQQRDAAALATESPLALERRLGIRIYPHCRVERIDAQARRLHTSLGDIDYGQLVLATGASPLRLPIEGCAEALLSVNNLRDYQTFRARLDRGAQRIAILGDGLIGCEFANDLASNGYAVRVIGLGAWPMERLLPETAGRHLQQALAELGVQWHLRTTLQRIETTANGYRLNLADGQSVEATWCCRRWACAPTWNWHKPPASTAAAGSRSTPICAARSRASSPWATASKSTVNCCLTLRRSTRASAPWPGPCWASPHRSATR